MGTSDTKTPNQNTQNTKPMPQQGGSCNTTAPKTGQNQGQNQQKKGGCGC